MWRLGIDAPAPGAGQRPGGPTASPAGTGWAILAARRLPATRYLYVACQASDQVFGFSIGAHGSLQPVPFSPVAAGDFAFGALVSPRGRHLYVTSVGAQGGAGEGVWAYTIGMDGRLTALPNLPFVDRGVDPLDPADDANGPVGLAFAPDGAHLYVSNFDTTDVSTFEVAASGALTGTPETRPRTPGNGPAFDSVTVRPNQGPVASFTVTAGPAGQPTRFDASGSSDPDGQVARYDWDFGDGTHQANAGPQPTHVYRYPGRHRATLTVTDNEGCSTSLVFTGQTVVCGGSAAARQTTSVVTP